jgi:hypothetical protein
MIDPDFGALGQSKRERRAVGNHRRVMPHPAIAQPRPNDPGEWKAAVDPVVRAEEREISSRGPLHPGGTAAGRLTSPLRSWADASPHSLIPRPRTRSVGDCRGQTGRNAETDQIGRAIRSANPGLSPTAIAMIVTAQSGRLSMARCPHVTLTRAILLKTWLLDR